MMKIKIFDKLKLTKDEEKWLLIGFITMLLLLVFYAIPIAAGLLLITDLTPSPTMKLILLASFGMVSILTVHYTFKYGFRACVRLAINDYEIRQRKKKEKEEKEGLEHG